MTCLKGIISSFVIVTAVALISTASFARDVMITPMGPEGESRCSMVGSSNLGVNFNVTEKDMSTVKNLLDSKQAEIRQIAAGNGITSIDLQSMNYNVNTSGSASKKCYSSSDEGNEAITYQVYGNFNWKIEPEENVLPFMEALIQKGFNANVNVNTHKQCQ